MYWSAFVGVFVGATVGFFYSLVDFSYMTNICEGGVRTPQRHSCQFFEILERYLEERIRQNFDQLFPEWEIYTDGDKNGVRYRTGMKGAGEIDFLCLDPKNNFVVIELKRDRASDKVSSQIERYINWLRTNLAKPEQQVRGIIIAESFKNSLVYSLLRKDDINLWQYDWKLDFQEVDKASVSSDNELAPGSS